MNGENFPGVEDVKDSVLYDWIQLEHEDGPDNFTFEITLPQLEELCGLIRKDEEAAVVLSNSLSYERGVRKTLYEVKKHSRELEKVGCAPQPGLHTFMLGANRRSMDRTDRLTKKLRDL